MNNKIQQNRLDFAKKFNQETLDVLDYGSAEKMLETLNELYKNIFLYFIPECEDYNTLDFNDRMAINEMVTGLSSLLQIVLKYESKHWRKDEVLVTAQEAEVIDTIYESLTFNKEDYHRLIDLLTVTTTLYKYIILKEVPSPTVAGTYFYCTQLKTFFLGYENFGVRVKRAIAAYCCEL